MKGGIEAEMAKVREILRLAIQALLVEAYGTDGVPMGMKVNRGSSGFDGFHRVQHPAVLKPISLRAMDRSRKNVPVISG